MSENVLNIKNLLDIIFEITKKNAHILADRYLLKDVSIISKWKNHKVNLKDNDISRIVDFAISESTESQRRIMRDKIEELILSSSLKEDIKIIVLNAGTFNEFLVEVLNIATSLVLYTKNLNQSIITHTCEVKGKDESACDIERHRNINYIEADLAENIEIEGKYSGFINFDLILFKRNDGRGKNVAKKTDMNLVVVSASLVKQNV